MNMFNWVLQINIPTPDPDLCEECGQYPKRIEDGIKHPYCSRTCAQASAVTCPVGNTHLLSAGSAQYKSANDDLCVECLQYPKSVERGVKHPYCSRTCATRALTRTSPAATTVPAAGHDMCQGCGKFPRATENGVTYAHCSKTCAKKWSTTHSTTCALLGCSNAVKFGKFCSAAHSNQGIRPRHRSLEDRPLSVPQDPRQVKSTTAPRPSHTQIPLPGPLRHRILFYHKHNPHYGFTNFSPHPVVFLGKSYPTSEHLFQSFKFQKHYPDVAEHIRTCSDYPSVVFSEARRLHQDIRSDWNRVKIRKMDITLWHKFTQHPDLKAELLATGDAELVEDSDKDAFWGVGPDGRGRNELGKALERLRARLRVSGQ